MKLFPVLIVIFLFGCSAPITELNEVSVDKETTGLDKSKESAEEFLSKQCEKWAETQEVKDYKILPYIRKLCNKVILDRISIGPDSSIYKDEESGVESVDIDLGVFNSRLHLEIFFGVFEGESDSEPDLINGGMIYSENEEFINNLLERNSYESVDNSIFKAIRGGKERWLLKKGNIFITLTTTDNSELAYDILKSISKELS